MAERKFNYTEVASIYKNIRNITGDASNPDSIAGILYSIDQEVQNKVNVCEEAVFGDLGSQLLLDWDNTSANFDGFVEKFNNWAALIVQSAGNYSQFENDIAGFKEANPLGATSGGIKDAYTNTGFYSQYSAANKTSFVEALDSLGTLNEVNLDNIKYVYSDSKAILTRHKIVTGVMLAGDIWSGLVIGSAAAGYFSSAVTDSTTSEALVPVNQATDVANVTNTATQNAGINLLGEGQSISIDQAIANTTNSTNLATLNNMKAAGVRVVATNGTEVQFLDANGHVLWTQAANYGTSANVANAATATTETVNSAASVSNGSQIIDVEFRDVTGAASNGIVDAAKNAFDSLGSSVKSGLSIAGNSIKNGVGVVGTALKSGVETAGTALKSGVETAGTALKSGVETAGTVLKSGASTVASGAGDFAASHPIVTNAGVAVGTNLVMNNVMNNSKNNSSEN